MKAIENPDGTFKGCVNNYGLIEWDETHFCTVFALTPEECALFHVVEFQETNPPAFTRWQNAREVSPIKVDNIWT